MRLTTAVGVLLAVPACAWAATFSTPPAVKPNPNPAVPLAAVVSFSTSEPVESRVQISDGQNEWELRFSRSHRPEEGLPVLGMRPGRRHTIRVFIPGSESEPLEFVTPPLPTGAAEFPPITVNASQPERMEPGVTVLSVRRNHRDEPDSGTKYGLLLGLDAAGEVVWYYRTDIRISDFEICRNGNIVYLTADHRAIEIDLLGNPVHEWYASRGPHGQSDGMPIDTMTFHHAIEELPSGNLLVLGGDVREIDNYYTSETDPDAQRATQKVMGDEVIEFTREGKVVWRWNTFDHLPIERLGYLTFNRYWPIRGFPEVRDWTHGNGLFFNESDNSILFSSRQQSAIIRIERPSGDISWILAQEPGWPGELSRKLLRPNGPMDWLWHQHAPTITPRGTLLLFNNDILQARPFDPPVDFSETYSRAVEYGFDSDAKTVHTVWASDTVETARVSTFAMGDTSLLPDTGNVFVCYGGSTLRLRPGEQGRGRSWALVREVTHTDPPEVLFEVVLAAETGRPTVSWVLFGGERTQILLERPPER